MTTLRARTAPNHTILTTEQLQAYLASLGAFAFAIFNDAGDIDQLRQKCQNDLLALTGRAEKIQARADAENRETTAKEDATIEGIYLRFKDKKAEIEELDSRPVGRKTLPDPLPGDSAPPRRGIGGPQATVGVIGTRRPELRMENLFRDDRPDNGQWRDFREYIGAIHSGLADPRFIKAATGGSEGTGVDGGFAVPSQFSDRLLNLSLESEIVRPRAQVVGMNSNILEMPLFDDEDHSANIAGFSAQWLAEGGTATEQKGKLRNISLKAHKLGIWSKLTSDLIEDSSTFEGRLEGAMAQAIGWNADQAFITGTGAGQPQGILNAKSKIEVAKETSQVADTIVYENLIKMWARLWPRGAGNAIWLVHPSTLPQLLKLQRIIQNVAASENVGGDTLNVQTDAAGGMTLLTRPVVITEHMNVLGDAGDVVLADLSQYLIGLRRTVTSQREISSGWLTDEVGIRTITRLDGQDTWSQAFQPRTGSTLSWVVTLAARA